MNLEDIKEEIESNFESYPEEVREYINYLENKNIEYLDFILDIKAKLYNKKYLEAERDLSNVIFNGINVDGYE
tara:strand:- start:85 stop:303 length:219 start_codon:yes stop_codon:yes gene_type:complete